MASLSQRGLSLVEALVTLALLGTASAAILPAFVAQMDSNNLAELRTGAISAVEIKLEELRSSDLTALPSSGQTGPESIAVGTYAYDVTVSYCDLPGFCDVDSRHLIVEVWFDNRRIYDAETIFTVFE